MRESVLAACCSTNWLSAAPFGVVGQAAPHEHRHAYTPESNTLVSAGSSHQAGSRDDGRPGGGIEDWDHGFGVGWEGGGKLVCLPPFLSFAPASERNFSPLSPLLLSLTHILSS